MNKYFNIKYIKNSIFFPFIILACLLSQMTVWSQDKNVFPVLQNPPKLVNDFAQMLQKNEADQLEELLVAYDKSSSVQIAIVTVKTVGYYDISLYAAELFQQWGIGQKGKDNGVLILVSYQDNKVFISTGRGVNSIITDAVAGRIIRNEIAPNFKEQKYYQGFYSAAESIIQATKGEYKNDKPVKGKEERGVSILGLLFVLLILFLVFLFSGRGGGGKGGKGGGNYMSRRGSDVLTGIILGNILGGRGGFGGGGGGFGGGGFGGFGGGSTDGGGAGGSW